MIKGIGVIISAAIVTVAQHLPDTSRGTPSSCPPPPCTCAAAALAHAPSHLTERATHAHPLHPAALASVPYGIVLVRVRVRIRSRPKEGENRPRLRTERLDFWVSKIARLREDTTQKTTTIFCRCPSSSSGLFFFWKVNIRSRYEKYPDLGPQIPGFQVQTLKNTQVVPLAHNGS